MTELLNAQNITVAGILLCAVVYLVKSNTKAIEKQEKVQSEKDAYILKSLDDERERHKIEEDNLKSELKDVNLERTEERKEWLSALNNIGDKFTNEMKNIANKLEAIPQLREDVSNVQEEVSSMKGDIKSIKEKIDN